MVRLYTGDWLLSLSSGLYARHGTCQPLISCTNMRSWRPRIKTLTPLIGLLVSASSSLPSQPTDAPEFTFEFNRGPQGFTADFADYPPAHAPIYELTSDYRTLPPPLQSRSGLFLSGVNRSDDLFMFLKGSISGLQPGAVYTVTVNLEIATNTPTGCVGVGGAPGESVWIKAGVSAAEPLPVLKGSHLRMSIDVGVQSNGGEQAAVLGNVANSRSCEQPRQWELKSFEDRPMPAPIAIPADGRVWLLFGTDSGFESRTEIYFTRASVTFIPMAAGGRGRCTENYVTARAIRSREAIPAFVQCAAEYAQALGEAEARRAFNEDARWQHGQIHLFVHGLEPSGDNTLTHVFPPDPSQEGTISERSIDEFGTDYSFELHRLLSLVDEGWIYYAFTNAETGLRQPKSSYVKEIEWYGGRAAIGAAYYSPDLPGTCGREEVNAFALNEAPSDEKLREFVRCAALEVEASGYFAGPMLSADPRWKHGSIYVFGVDAETGEVEFSGSESMFTFSGRIPELFDGRDMLKASAEFGETFWYYSVMNPETGAVEPRTAFVKLVRAQGAPLLLGAGYKPSAVASSK